MLRHNLKQMAALQRQWLPQKGQQLHTILGNGNNHLNLLLFLKVNQCMISVEPFASGLFSSLFLPNISGSLLSFIRQNFPSFLTTYFLFLSRRWTIQYRSTLSYDDLCTGSPIKTIKQILRVKSCSRQATNENQQWKKYDLKYFNLTRSYKYSY